MNDTYTDSMIDTDSSIDTDGEFDNNKLTASSNKIPKKKADLYIDSETSEEEKTNDLDVKMMENYSYPSPSDPNFQLDIYQKRDFQIHRIPDRSEIKNYGDLKEFRDNTCARDIKLTETQVLLGNFINPNTPYKGILIYHGTGVGKSCAAISIAEKFKPMVEKYGTRIHVLVPGPLNKQGFLGEILKCTGETYLNTFQDKTTILDEAEENKIKKNAMNIVSQYYRLMSYRSFYKQVLGEKIRERIVTGNKVRFSNRKTESGEIERDLSIDRIYDLNNGLLIIDEAHNITDNEWGAAVKKIIENSTNLRIVLLSATPMKNLADDIVELINFLRPKDHLLQRDKIFTSQRNHEMAFKPNGREYLRKMVSGYVSFLRGADPVTFAERVDIGEIPPGLSFTKVTRCFMLPFQMKTYENIMNVLDDSLYQSSENAANFVFPGFSRDKKSGELEGFYGIEGMSEIKSQLKNNANALCTKLASTILSDYKIKDPTSLMYLKDNGKVITGDIFKEEYLKYFSIKFYTALKNINDAVYGKKGNGLLFVFSNLVQVGIMIFKEVLENNGYLEYQENIYDYHIKSDTRCYFCDHRYGNHNHLPPDVPKHKFYPAAYVSVTGKTEDNLEQIPEEKHRLLKNIFNNIDNKNGKYIKIVIGSKVMNEGITLRNIKEVQILDVHFTLGRVDQAIGRGIRFCTHYDIMTEDNPYPKVEVYKYVVSLKNRLTSEEEIYKKAENKYQLIKETERILQEEAIDCPLNRNGNIFKEELKRYANCGTADNQCPPICGYMSCDYKCGDRLLNTKYYDPERNIYRKVAKADLDYSTYSNSLASEEIEYAKSTIKTMFRVEHLYTLADILAYINKSYPADKRDMFDDYYVYQALDELIPVTNNDFNNFHDTVVDKYNRPGYLIYRNKYYIFQPFNENEELPMFYRRNYGSSIINRLSIKNYIQNTDEYKKYKNTYKKLEIGEPDTFVAPKQIYDFDTVQEYYDGRDEFDYVGIIDQESTRKKIKDSVKDVFKIRAKRPKFLSKKRETGIPSFKGAVCSISKDKQFLTDIANKINLKIDPNEVREGICDMIRDKLYDLEKYSTKKLGNKMTYLIVPANHFSMKYYFPLNLEDRLKSILNEIQRETRTSINPEIVTTKSKGQFSDIEYVKYQLVFDSSMDKFADIMELHHATKDGKNWVINVD